jgi:hypothetical protein
MVNWRAEIRFLIKEGTKRILQSKKGEDDEGMEE